MSPTTTAERAELRMMARELARRELIPRAASLDAGGQDALHECWRLLVELGLDRALLSEQHGGVELSVLDLLVTIEELAVGDGGIAMCVLLCNAALATLGDEQLAEVPWGARWVLVPATPEVEVTVSGGRLDGRLACALGAHGAHGLVVLLDGPAPVAWAVDAGAAGSKLERDLAQLGLRAAPAASVELTGVACAPAADGSDGYDTAISAASALALLRAGTAAIAHGIARRAYEMALEYAHARQQGGVAIVEHDAVSDMLSAMAVRLACWPGIAADHGSEIDQAQALAVKIAATDAAVASTTDAVQVFGGTGYMVETGIEKLMRDAKYCQLFPEPNWVAHDELMRIERAGRGAARARST
ncbi:MAG TPA: acyl-CoA dehydrogenase family protein [Solirubrobacteraceae bacterium]|nr:acyl-CoA dehydrogenase family protein [Solirubrobacteraceae bacterium]